MMPGLLFFVLWFVMVALPVLWQLREPPDPRQWDRYFRETHEHIRLCLYLRPGLKPEHRPLYAAGISGADEYFRRMWGKQ